MTLAGVENMNKDVMKTDNSQHFFSTYINTFTIFPKLRIWQALYMQDVEPMSERVMTTYQLRTKNITF